MDRAPEQRTRLAAVEAELRQLQAWYEQAMSAFKFDEADAAQRHIAGLEAERQMLLDALPAPIAGSEPPVGVVPEIGRPVRRGRANRRR
jgi:hypothetical protein